MKNLGVLNPEVLGLLASMWESEAEAMLDQIGVAPGASCIDLGCGAAGILRPLSVRVGAAGRVVGLEPDPRLLAAARRYAGEQALSNVQVLAGDIFDGAPPPTAPPRWGHSTSSMPASSPRCTGGGRSCCGRCSLWPAPGGWWRCRSR